MTRPAARRTSSPQHRCTDCGWASVKWTGRCQECHAWGTVEAVGSTSVTRVSPGPVSAPALPIGRVASQPALRKRSGVDELDRVLGGGGLVPGSVLLLAGEPGVGKSTLLLEVAAQTARQGATTLFVSGEESASQVRLRGARTGALEDSLFLATETDLAAVLSHIEVTQPALLVIDSVQTISSGDVDGPAGGVAQVRAVTAALVRVAKERHLPTLLVGHVTKDGGIAGPRALEHLVDVVLHFEGERNSPLRVLRAVKNRFGPVDEIGCFELGEDGIKQVLDPTGLFLSRHVSPATGTCVTVSMEGRRPLLAEVQSLVTNAAPSQPRRSVSGLDSSRLAMLLAVLHCRAGVDLAARDVYAATVGGASLRGPDADLAIAVSLASSAAGVAVPHSLVACGEVGLAGELRLVPNLALRLSEAARLGFTVAVVPDLGSVVLPALDGLRVIECRDVHAALRVLRLAAPRARPVTAELHAVG